MTVSMDEKETVVSTSILYSTYCFIALLLSHTLDLLSPIKYFNNTRARQRIQYKSFEFENKVHVHNELNTAAISFFFIQAMMLPT